MSTGIFILLSLLIYLILIFLTVSFITKRAKDKSEIQIETLETQLKILEIQKQILNELRKDKAEY